MKANTFLSLALLLVSAALFSCGSTSEDKGARHAEHSEIDCVCGEPGADIVGCHCELCLAKAPNPANPLCNCAGLAPVGPEGLTVGSGGPGTASAFPRQEYIHLRSGAQLRAELVSDDGAMVRLRRANGAEETYKYEQLDPRTVYRLMKARTAKDDGPGQLAIGDYARESGFYAHAKRHYHDALKADESLEPKVDAGLAALRVAASDTELARAEGAMDKGDESDARDHLRTVLREFPDENAATQAGTLLSQLDARQDEMTVAESGADVERELAPARKHYDRAVEKNRDGLLASGKQTKAIGLFESSLGESDKARRILAKIDVGDANSMLARQTSKLDGEVVEVMIQAHINTSSIYTARTSYNQALAEVNQILALDSKNAEARQMRARIESAAGDGDYGGWGRPVIGRPRRR